ncbi:MAG: class I SAM-dependent methyltransferase [Spirochaetales bacterium]|nr:class I SAM-dependent methyltransferase [Spirochaetales bacterium]
MPTMYEIYQKHSFEYDELVAHEDYLNHIPEYLKNCFDFQGKTVLEFGTGTGRMTRMYAGLSDKVYCFDRSAHMLEKASEALSEYGNKIEFSVCDNLNIDSLDVSADIVIQGWSFGHTVSDNESQIEKTVNKLVVDCNVRLKRGGSLVFLESLGTNTESPEAPNKNLKDFYSELEGRHGFSRTVLETDYRFDSNEDAARIMGFFFGEEMGSNLKFTRDGIVREYTGVWQKKI